jgi:hypothetical protein
MRRRIEISWKMELQLGFMSPSDPDWSVQACASVCSKILVLKSKNRIQDEKS